MLQAVESQFLPLTDSLRSALGCVVYGGNEKVEMVRELARNVGRMFAIFAGGQTVSATNVLRFLCAVVQIGAWGCFQVK